MKIIASALIVAIKPVVSAFGIKDFKAKVIFAFGRHYGYVLFHFSFSPLKNFVFIVVLRGLLFEAYSDAYTFSNRFCITKQLKRTGNIQLPVFRAFENIKYTVAGSRIKCFIIVTVFSCSACYVISNKKTKFCICAELSREIFKATPHKDEAVEKITKKW